MCHENKGLIFCLLDSFIFSSVIHIHHSCTTSVSESDCVTTVPECCCFSTLVDRGSETAPVQKKV